MRKFCTTVFLLFAVFGGQNAADELYQWKSVAIRGGGFVPGIIFSPAKPDVIYCRTDMAGAYRWDAVKYGWEPITDWMNRQEYKYFGIESIAPDPMNADTIYIAGGTYMVNKGAILRSRDRGNTWQIFTQIGVPMGANHNGRSMGERLAVDPLKTNILYFGSRNDGLLRSTNYGENWSPVTSFPVKGIDKLGLSFVFFDKRGGSDDTSSKTIYVGAASDDERSNLYRSIDGGQTWNLMPGGPTKMMPHHAILASNGTIYTVYNNNPGPNGITDGMVWKLNTQNDQWTDISPPRGKHGFGGISAAVSNPNFILVTTIDRWEPPDEIYRSTDAGKTWTPIGLTAQHDRNGAEYLRWGDPDCKELKCTGWMGDIDIDPFNPKRAFYVTGQGVWSSNNIDAEDPGDIVWRFENDGLEETVVLDMPSAYKGVVFSAVGDIGGCRHAELDKPPSTGMYSNPVFGNGDGIDWAGLNPNIVVRCGTGRQNGAYSTDNGLTWKPFAAQPPSPSPRNGGKIAIASDGSTIVWTLGREPSYSRDWGQSWKSCEGLPSRVRVTSDRVDPNLFYAFSEGTLYVSKDGGTVFTAAATGLDYRDKNIRPEATRFSGRNRVHAVFDKRGDVWIAAGENMYHSKDAGANTVKVENVQYVYAMGFGKAASGRNYPAIYLVGIVKDTYGVFRSTDEGASWIRINDDKHEFGAIDHCAGDETVFGHVYLGPHGRGIIYGQPAVRENK